MGVVLKPILLIPARNEADHLPYLLRDWADHAAVHADLCLVLDRCDDRSAAVAAARRRDLPDFQVFETENNRQGKSGALRQAMDRLPEIFPPHRFVLLWDADREYDLRAAPSMIENIPDTVSSDAFLVSGCRHGRLLPSSRIANRVIRAALALRTGRLPPTDVLTGSRLLQAEHLRDILSSADGFDLETRIVRHFLDRDGLILEWPVPYAPRRAGKKIRPWHIFSLLRAAVA